jgi:hypothetical protein
MGRSGASQPAPSKKITPNYPQRLGATYWTPPQKKNSHKAISLVGVNPSLSRDGRIRTGDPCNPIAVRYRAAPRPEGERKVILGQGRLNSIGKEG